MMMHATPKMPVGKELIIKYGQADRFPNRADLQQKASKLK
jgi:hypothetical protein